MTQINNSYEAWFLLLAFMQFINLGGLIIIIIILLYNIIKRNERFKPIEKQDKKEVGFGK